MSLMFILSVPVLMLLSGSVAWAFYGHFPIRDTESSTRLSILEAALQLSIIIGAPLLIVGLSYDPARETYPAEHDWFGPIGAFAGYAAWYAARQIRTRCG